MSTLKEQVALLMEEVKKLAEANAELKANQRVEHGAIWVSNGDGKSDIRANLRCPQCESENVHFFNATGADGVETGKNGGTLPIYRCTFAKKSEPLAKDAS